MNKEIKKLENSKFEVTVSCDKEAWKAAQEKAFKELAKNVKVDGFRPGKAPEAMLRARVNPGDILDKAIRYVLQDMYDDVLKDETIRPFAQPRVNVTKVSNEELEVVFAIVGAPEVKLGAYKDLKAEKKVAEVKDEQIDSEITKALQQNAQLTVVEREAKMGDTVTIDFEGFVDGVAFEGGKAENYALELGSHQFIPGFEEQLVGVKADEDRDVNVTFPENYVENLKGKAATFKIKVHEVKEKSMPELDDDFVAELNIENVKTVDEYKAFVRKNLEAKAAQDADNAYYQDIVKQIRDGSKIEIAQEIIDSEVDAMKENFSKQLAQQGLDMKKYLEITGVKEEDMTKQMASEAEINIRSVLVLDEIAKVENIEVTEADLEFEYAKIADQYKMEIEKVKEILGQNKDRMMQEIRARRIRDFLFANNK